MNVEFAPLQRKKLPENPAIEKYVFVPNKDVALTYEDSCRTNVQIALENTLVTSVKVVEYVYENLRLLAPETLFALQQNPSFTILPEYILVSETEIEVPGTVVHDRITPTGDAFLVILEKALSEPNRLDSALKIIKHNGFVISRESPDFKLGDLKGDLVAVTIHDVVSDDEEIQEKLLLIRRKSENETVKPKALRIVNEEYDRWLIPLKRSVSSGERVVIYSQGEDLSGILALFRCYRLEVEDGMLQCVLIEDHEAKDFDLEDEFYSEQLEKGIAVNVLSGGKWGSMRFLLFPELLVRSGRCLLDDLPSRGPEWVEAPEIGTTSGETVIVEVCYAGVCWNEKIPSNVATKSSEDYVFDYSGKSGDRRVMGLTSSVTVPTLLPANENFIYPVPKNWNLEEAATVPAAYLIAIYALFLVRTFLFFFSMR